MNKKMLWLMAFIFLASAFAVAGQNLNCSIVPAGSCTETIMLRMQNDTGGINNSMVQNASVATYNYALCCDANAAGDTITTSCEDTTFLKLSSLTNAHVQNPSINTYPVDACISATLGNVSCSYSTTCAPTQECLLSMANSDGSNSTNAHVGTCDAYSLKVCCGMSTPPTVPVPYQPNATNYTINRTPEFIWYNSTDADGEPVTYSIWVDNNSDFSSPEIYDVGIPEGGYPTLTSYVNSTILGVDYIYYWKVQACNSQCSANSSVMNFTLDSYIDVQLVNGSINFNTLAPGATDNTLDDTPYPFVIRNRGNVPADVNITGSNLWQLIANPSSYFQYRIGIMEAGSYVSALDSAWQNVNTTTYSTAITGLNWSSVNDEAQIDIGITVPYGEPPGAKNATINITFYQG